MDYLELIETMPPDVYRNLVRAVELGKWPDGRALTPEQRESTLQAIIAWGERHLPESERVGYMENRKQSGEACEDTPETPLNWK